MPSGSTIAAMETLRLGCIAAGLTNKIDALCVFVPDSVIAATTPLFKHLGSDPWTNFNFVIGDLTVNGLKGDGLSKALDTGIKLKDIQLPSTGSTIGFTVIVSESASNQGGHAMGQQDADGVPLSLLLVSSSGLTEFYPTTLTGTQRVSSNDWGRVGYISGNRWVAGGSTNIALFVASPLESHKTLVSIVGPGEAAGTTSTDDTISVFASKRDGTNSAYSTLRLSMAMVHDGFTQTESSNFWVLAKQLREQLGGGTGDNIHDWNRKVVAAGGASVSTTTSNAMRTLYSGLDTVGTLYLMSSANALVPDNLTAARTPFIWQSGSEVWTNFNFGTTNLTVAGLQGNGTDKYLGTGIVPSTANRISNTSGGITALISDNPGTALFAIMGSLPITASVQTVLYMDDVANAGFRMWRNDLINQNWITAAQPSPGAAWEGYISGNRTAANAIALYVASTGLAHQVLTNATGTQTGTATANTRAFLAFAQNNNGTPITFGNQTMSFVAFHGGMTQTQSSNTYSLISEFRVAVGGGNP